MGKAKFKLSLYELERLLALPYETRVLCVHMDDGDKFNKSCIVTVEHPDLPKEISVSSWAYDVTAISPKWKETNTIGREFLDWGIPK